jgi:hypothetical protein
MNRLLAAVVTLSFSTAYAQKPAETPKTGGAPPAAAPPPAGAPPAGAPPGEMGPPKPGPETEALKPFAKSITSTGTMNAGAMGPGSPEMPTKGKATCKWVLNNLWIACDIEETSGAGKTAMKWQGHWVFGYDFLAKGYRGTMTSSMGAQMRMKGTLEAQKLTWETVDEMKMPGMPSKTRITLDATDPKAIKFTDEGLVGGKWVAMSTATHRPAGGGK